jgi:hypothetical protein
MLVGEGTRLVFGRGPGVDLIIAAGRGLSRRAGLVTAMATGVWIANISRTHALYVEGDGYQVRLPRMEHDGEPANGWFVHAGTALVGSRAMLDEGQSLMVTVTGQFEESAAGRRAGWPEEAEPAATGLTRGRLAATGLADEGEWTDEVCAASAASQVDLDDGGRGGATLTAAALTGAALAAAGQEARDRAAGSGPADVGPAAGDEAGEADGPGRQGRRRDAAAVLPGPDDEALPGRADLVPPVAGRSERDQAAAAHAGNRQGRPRGHRRLSRAGTVRRRPGVP